MSTGTPSTASTAAKELPGRVCQYHGFGGADAKSGGEATDLPTPNTSEFRLMLQGYRIGQNERQPEVTVLLRSGTQQHQQRYPVADGHIGRALATATALCLQAFTPVPVELRVEEIYEYTTTGTLLGHFDVAAYGVGDPETVEYNELSDTLFVLSNRQSGPIIVETTKTGALLQTIDVSSGPDFKPAGLAYAPASNGTGVKRFYFVDRGIDNNNDPRIIDGKIFEFTAPGSGPHNEEHAK